MAAAVADTVAAVAAADPMLVAAVVAITAVRALAPMRAVPTADVPLAVMDTARPEQAAAPTQVRAAPVPRLAGASPVIPGRGRVTARVLPVTRRRAGIRLLDRAAMKALRRPMLRRPMKAQPELTLQKARHAQRRVLISARKARPAPASRAAFLGAEA